ncbi:MAG: 3-deoxy-manno-octulosonate cytidylyltransferase [Acidobacteriia bacterium]|nr:3-deoxy-manno-octulosonate cytidylyltransferase [Terriglobia bacterium]
MSRNVIVVIPARFSSTRFPGKPLVNICGHTMIEWVYRRACRARSVGRVCVATDDTRIRDAVSAFGGRVVMTSRRHTTGTDRLAEVARRIRETVIVNVQGDEPLIDPRAIDATVRAFVESRARCPVATLKSRICDAREARDPHVVKVVTDDRDEAIYFSRAPIPHVPAARLKETTGHRAKGLFKHLGLYVYSRSFLLKWARLKTSYLEPLEKLEQLRILENGYKIKVLETPYSSPSVDTPRDVRIVEEEIRKRRIQF